MSRSSLAAAWLDDSRTRVERRLEAFFVDKLAQAEGVDDHARSLVEELRVFTLRGGKRIRPALVALGYRLFAGAAEIPEPIWSAATALELLQSHLLIQDDWMDRDEERRGGPTLHAALGAKSEDPHHTASISILASDLAIAYAFELLTTHAPPACAAQAAYALSRIEERVVLGQLLDLERAGGVETMHRLKTAEYTVSGPLRMGAILAGADDSALGLSEQIGVPLGVAFQLRDDLLGTFGSGTGKSASNDLRRGKRTALIEDAQAHAKKEDLEDLTGALGRADATEAEVEAARRVLERVGSKARVEARAKALEEEAVRVIEEGLPAGEAREILLSFVALLSDRRR